MLRLLADGCSRQQAAERMGLSPHTVHSYCRRAYAKLDARTSSHAVAIAMRRGILPGYAGLRS